MLAPGRYPRMVQPLSEPPQGQPPPYQPPRLRPRLGQTPAAASTAAPAAGTLGELHASGHRYRGVKDEVRQNLIARLRAGQDPFPAILPFDPPLPPHLHPPPI